MGLVAQYHVQAELAPLTSSNMKKINCQSATDKNKNLGTENAKKLAVIFYQSHFAQRK